MRREERIGMTVEIVPLQTLQAVRIVETHYREQCDPRGNVFAIGAVSGSELVGVAIVGFPTKFVTQERTVELRHCCVRPQAPEGTSEVLRTACWRAARALGWRWLLVREKEAIPA
jgi:hypothetical protein